MTLTTQAVLRILLEDVGGRHYGFEIGKKARVATGSLYPILDRLEKAGWIAAQWETLDPHQAGRPRRRYYRLTPEGTQLATNALAETLNRITPVRWRPVPGTP
jgi:DNA-binding PadR family transcriptional regulator